MQSERIPITCSRSTSKVIANLPSPMTNLRSPISWLHHRIPRSATMVTVRFLSDATRVIVADTLTSMLQTCERLDKYKKDFSEMLLEQDGGGGRTAQQNQEERKVRSALSPSLHVTCVPAQTATAFCCFCCCCCCCCWWWFCHYCCGYHCVYGLEESLPRCSCMRMHVGGSLI